MAKKDQFQNHSPVVDNLQTPPAPAADVKAPDAPPAPAADVKAPDAPPAPAADVKAPDAPPAPAADVKAPDAPPAPAAVVPPAPVTVVYTIAPGKSITSLKGILAEGAECKASYFSGGKETLENLVERGFVVKS